MSSRNVARACGVLELGEDLRVRLVKDVREHVEPAAVRHPEQHVADVAFGGFADDLVEHGHEHVEPFDRKPRLAGKRAVQKALEGLDLGQPLEQGDGIDRVGRRAETCRAPRLGAASTRSSGTKMCA